VPAGPALAPGGVPGGLAGLGLLPQREVARVLLALALDVPVLLDELVRVLVGQLPVVLEAVHVEVHVALGDVGVPVVEDRLVGLDDVLDVVGDLRPVVCALEGSSSKIASAFACSRLATRSGSPPVSLAWSMILSSTSVMFCTCTTS
jgi:hypothetical protein